MNYNFNYQINTPMDHLTYPMYKVSSDHLIITIQNCEKTCYQMTTKILEKPDLNLRKRQLSLLSDCAEVCTSTSILLSHLSDIIKDQVTICIKVSEACANECSKFPDNESQRCAAICLNCAQECKQYLLTL